MITFRHIRYTLRFRDGAAMVVDVVGEPRHGKSHGVITSNGMSRGIMRWDVAALLSSARRVNVTTITRERVR